MSDWYLYLIKNTNSTYIGISTDPIRRLNQHNKIIGNQWNPEWGWDRAKLEEEDEKTLAKMCFFIEENLEEEAKP